MPPGSLTYSLAGAPAGASIDPTTGVFTWTPTEAQGPGSYSFDVLVSDGAASDSETIQVTVDEGNLPPVITSDGGGATATLGVTENGTSVTTVAASDADLPAQTLSYSINGGADAALFQINSASGVLSFLVATNHEAPTDAGADNVYDVTVQVAMATAAPTPRPSPSAYPMSTRRPRLRYLARKP